MSIRSSIRNFFYAITHADALVEDRKRLLNENKAMASRIENLTSEQAKTAVEAKQYQQLLHKGIRQMMPAEQLTTKDVVSLYNSVQGLDRQNIFNREHFNAYSKFWYLSQLGNATKSELDRIRYTNALVGMGVLPESYYIRKLDEEGKRVVCEAVGVNKLPHDMPVGQIEYLDTSGEVQEVIQYYDPVAFLDQACADNYCGVPMGITIYMDAHTGNYMEAPWATFFDPPLQSLRRAVYEPARDPARNIDQLIENAQARQAAAPEKELATTIER